MISLQSKILHHFIHLNELLRRYTVSEWTIMENQKAKYDTNISVTLLKHLIIYGFVASRTCHGNRHVQFWKFWSSSVMTADRAMNNRRSLLICKAWASWRMKKPVTLGRVLWLCMLGCSQAALSTACAGHQLLPVSRTGSLAVSLLSPPVLPAFR